MPEGENAEPAVTPMVLSCDRLPIVEMLPTGPNRVAGLGFSKCRGALATNTNGLKAVGLKASDSCMLNLRKLPLPAVRRFFFNQVPFSCEKMPVFAQGWLMCCLPVPPGADAHTAVIPAKEVVAKEGNHKGHKCS